MLLGVAGARGKFFLVFRRNGPHPISENPISVISSHEAVSHGRTTGGANSPCPEGMNTQVHCKGRVPTTALSVGAVMYCTGPD